MKYQQQEEQMVCESAQKPHLKLQVRAEGLSFFTTILQSGIELETQAGISLGKFLCSCAGFDEEYINKTVQTIFLNGTAVDDLQTRLKGSHPVIALSAAMPGLAGAIFRKNSLHSALRTTTDDSGLNPHNVGNITVSLKLFNSIAREKGELLLSLRVVISSGPLSTFLQKRPKLLKHVIAATFDSKNIGPRELMKSIKNHEYIKLYITTENE